MKKNWHKLLIKLFFAGSLLYLLWHVSGYLKNSLQMDLSAFYTAGESVRIGLNPYDNNIRHGIWDGVDRYENSRFLYPPMVAYLFIPLSLMPYSFAKIFWVAFNLFLLFYVLKKLLIHFKVYSQQNYLLCLALSFVFYPILSFFERGQIDMITLFLLTEGLLAPSKKASPLIKGLYLSLASIFKLHIFLIVPFLIVKKQWKEILVMAAFSVALFLVPFVLNKQISTRYYSRDIARIAKYGEGGNVNNLIDKKLLPAGFFANRTQKNQNFYAPTSLWFIDNASISKSIHLFLLKGPVNQMAPFTVQIILLIALFFLAYSVRKGDDFVFWMLSMSTVIMVSPLGWSMSLVWMVALFPWLIKNLRITISRILPLALIVVGLIYMLIPDYFLSQAIESYYRPPYTLKYVIAEILVFAGLITFELLSAFKKFTKQIERSSR